MRPKQVSSVNTQRIPLAVLLSNRSCNGERNIHVFNLGKRSDTTE